ncbi:breast carcinoma amplified sequence 2 [Anaeromyces robustus]|uniref:Breast carcinoma amplified sequence 2 n=1 Tax=Anaeromyces robustus TaxID=1754192 RepID=A0A1Y1XFK0_9FUNG|nr:breast carcinoma amplified sequence 2 [Anaeromyces robustus]|eukprot:ORX84541.1 breast carcinoma amplified sequence 2 [Anaeromyces robustus]
MDIDKVIIDALPYIDKEYDDPEMKKYVDNLIEEELKVTVKKDTSELPETIELFENDEILKNEMERIKNGEPFPLLDTIRYRLSDPQDHSNVDEWVNAVENSEAQLEHQYNRLINLELLNKFGANAWRYNNFQLEQILNEIKQKVDDKKNKIVDINKERKYLQTKSEAKLQQLEQQWNENVSKVLEIEAACHNLEMEIKQKKEAKQ